MRDTFPIDLERVSKTYAVDIGKKKTRALKELSLQVSKGEVFGIIGPNGAGKSTTLKILMGFVRPDAGRVTLAGLPASLPSSHEKLGFLPENPCLYDQLTIAEQLRFAARIAKIPKEQTSRRIEQLLTQTNLDHAANTPIRNFSKGMTQRAALAYALIHEPEILILDEPMSGLDPLGRQLVVDLIRDYNAKGHTILFSSHILTDVERICNRIGIMNKGRLISTISPQELDSYPIGPHMPSSTTPLEAYFLDMVANDLPGQGQ